MTGERLPLLILPQPSLSARQVGTANPPTLRLPGHERQAQRLAPKFERLQTAFEQRRVEIQATTPNADPDLVVVLETVGAVSDFASTVEKIPGLEWLFGAIERDLEPDEDFYDGANPDKQLGGRLFLLGSNRQALAQVVQLWNRYTEDPQSSLGPGLSAWKLVFKHLKDVRFWGPRDRVGDDIVRYWEERLLSNPATLRFEVEAWCSRTPQKNVEAAAQVRALVSELGGTVLHECLNSDIAYHAFLVEMPAASVREMVSQTPPSLVISEHVMFFRPRGQAFAWDAQTPAQVPDVAVTVAAPTGAPAVAIFDGLPLENHARLAGRLVVDDPDSWAANYPARDRNHGTAMASLVVWGELSSSATALSRPVYVRPILFPETDSSANPRPESTPDDQLLIDLVHRAVRRMYEGEGDSPPSAPTVKVINLSVGDGHRPFGGGELSPWARLIDWLSHKHQVLFVVSVGNASDELTLDAPRESIVHLSDDQRASLAARALMANDGHRMLLAPAEAINALTVGACHFDGSVGVSVPGRYSLFPDQGIAPYSRIGPGFRRSIKPDILLAGGRVLYSESPMSPLHETQVRGAWRSPAPPGHLVAAPPDAAGNATIFSRGTSNAAALGTRAAAHAFEVLESLRTGGATDLSPRFDAVLIKALLAHGAAWGVTKDQVLVARPDVDQWHRQKLLVARYAGYGLADVEKALTCTEQRATLLGVGDLRNDKALEFRIPIPVALNATTERRRLTVTLAWLSPTNSRHSKYRVGRLWMDVPDAGLRLTRSEGESRQVQSGTLQHEIFEGDSAVPILQGSEITIRVNCVADAGRLSASVQFALCVSLEVAEGVAMPIYQQVRARISPPISISAIG